MTSYFTSGRTFLVIIMRISPPIFMLSHQPKFVCYRQHVRDHRQRGGGIHAIHSNKFTFRISGDGDIFLASCAIRDLSGAYLVRAFDNYLKIKQGDMLSVERRIGKITVKVLDAARYLPAWTLKIMWRALPDFVHNNRAVVFDLEVIRPGVVRLKGVFVADDAVLAITKDKVYLLRPELNGPLALVGRGDGTEIRLSGPVTKGVAFGL